MKFSHHALLMAIAPPMVVLKCVAAASSPANTIAVSADQNSQASVPVSPFVSNIIVHYNHMMVLVCLDHVIRDRKLALLPLV